MSKESERAAEIITGNPMGSERLVQTAYGKKSIRGIAAIIDDCFAGRQVRCHSGHTTTHALWDCPVCTAEKEAALRNEILQLKATLAGARDRCRDTEKQIAGSHRQEEAGK